MGRVLDHIDDATITWIGNQHMFFVGTAPDNGGRVNLSPKGLDTFRVVNPTQVAYLDLTGSGAETIAHLRDNGRITFMFTAFDGPPRILRLYGTGSVHLPGEDQFDVLEPMFPERRGVRSIISTSIDRVQDSCGYSVPTMEYRGNRKHLDDWVEKRSDAQIEEYRSGRNVTSIDGLPALDV
jgi:hypothetical protein